MANQSSNSALSDWESSPSTSSLVSIGTHQLFVSISGPPRSTPTQPIVAIFPGSGSSSSSWKQVETLLVNNSVRTLLYDRSGLGRSEPGPDRDTGPLAAAELSQLLEVIGVPGPYVLVAHSYGGCVAREFLHLRDKDVAGMVLSETGTETPCQYAEEQYERQVLGMRPLSVIRGEAAFDAARIGKTSEQAVAHRGMIEAMQKADEHLKKEQLKLSRNHRFRNVENCGHSVHRDRPEVVAEEVGWVLANLAAPMVDGGGITPLPVVERASGLRQRLFRIFGVT